MGRIEATFERLRRTAEKALVPFVTAGDPSLEKTEALIHAMVEAGADIIELGIPFSDPMADGPTIQESSERALAAGTTPAKILDMVARVREHTNVPIVLMGYYNPVFHYGADRFSRDAAQAGVDGLLLVDLPPEEAGEILDFLQRDGLALITLLAPTTPPDRMARLTAAGQGYLYYVSMTGVTGSRQVDAGAIEEAVLALRAQSPVPVAVGFGISTAADAASIGRFADGVVVGSALVRIIGAYGASEELLPRVSSFISELKQGLRSGNS